MFQRQIKVSKAQSFFLFGARGTGKSTWLQEQFSEADHLWIDLTNPDVERRYARRPAILLEEWKTKAAYLKKEKKAQPPWVIIDEVQKIPEILDAAHVGIQRHKIRFALTGSSARKLKRGSANLLAGRAFNYHLWPLTYAELEKQFNLENYLRWGGLPGIYELTEDADKTRFLNAYYQTYLREEIQIEQLVSRIEPFRMFLDIVGQMSGEVMNIASLSREADIEPKSAERYFEILNDTLIGTYLPAYHRSIRKRQLQHPKFYLFDVGVWRAIRGELGLEIRPQTSHFGRAFEHFIITQIIALNAYLETAFRLSYVRTKDDAEVDLVLETPGKKLIMIEIKSSEKVADTELRTLASLCRDAKAKGFVLSRVTHAYDYDGVQILPWLEGIEKIFGLTP